MLDIGSAFYLQLSGRSRQRVLHNARTVGAKDNVYTAEVDGTGLAIEAGQNVLVHYEVNREFMQQSARINAIEETAPKLVIRFTTTGEPVSAEYRQIHRVPTVSSGIVAEVGPENACLVLDVSSTGFAAIGAERLPVGQVVPARITYDGRSYTGSVRIQSVREMDDGGIRYGLYCIVDKASPGSLGRGLQHISLAFQREELRRLACSS